jgi:hypothetical protein
VCNRPLAIPSEEWGDLKTIAIPEEYGREEDMDDATALAIRTMLAEENREAQNILKEQEAMTLNFLQEESKQRQIELDNKLYTCNICFDDLKIADIYILEDCEHRFCRECLGETCKAQINDGNTRDIKCPDPECDHIITYQEIRMLLMSRLQRDMKSFF